MSKRINRRFYLGTVAGGSVYIFTGLGDFLTEEQAVAKAQERPRNGRVLVFEQWDLVKHGVVYGSTGYEHVATVQ